MTKGEKKLVDDFLFATRLVMYDLRLGCRRFFVRSTFTCSGIHNYTTSSCDFIPLDEDGNGLLFLVG